MTKVRWMLVLMAAAATCGLSFAAEPAGPPAGEHWIEGDARAALRALEAERPTRETELNRAVLRLYAGDARGALEALAQLSRREPGWTPALRWLARAQDGAGGPEAADTAAALVSRGDAEVLDQLWAGELFARMGRPQDAQAAYERARRRNPAIDLDSQLAGSPREAPGPNRGGGAAHRASAPADARAELVPVRLAGASGLCDGERLRYEVKYLFLRLADVTLETGRPESHRGVPARRLVFTARSNDKIPFFHIRSRFESVVGEDGAVLAHRHVANDSDAGADQAGYDMDARAGRCTVRTARDGVFGYHVLPLPANAQDGVSLLQTARALARVRGSAVVPTAVDGLWWPTELRTLGVERIRWRGRDVPAVRMRSTGGYRGVGGATGAVEIWFSEDERAVPYRVKTKVAVGSVVLELLPDDALVARCPAAGGGLR